MFGKEVYTDTRTKLSESFKGNNNRTGTTVEILNLTNNKNNYLQFYTKSCTRIMSQ